ncbi:MAG: MotA/TolQ/ExbB proton channel family protein, partial [Planctomycetota bacterium]
IPTPDTRVAFTREAALEAALLAEDPRLERSLGLLAACAAIAPLLGLLGTVSGMITTFDVIAVHGSGDAGRLATGIAQALVTTQAGLLAAVPILLLHAGFSRAVDRRQMLLEEVANEVLGLEDDPDAADAHAVPDVPEPAP